MSDNNNVNTVLKVPISGYIALIFAIIFFAGIIPILGKITGWGWVNAFDFGKLLGDFGVVGGKGNFRGSGGTGAKDGFLFAITLVPSVMLALGIVELVDYFGGLKAAQRMLTPLLRPLMGIPGITGLALISSLQSTDAGASMTKALKESGAITESERTVFGMFQFTAGAAITNFLSSGMAIIVIVTELVPPIILISFCVMFFFKIVSANVIRIYVKKFGEE